MPTFPSPKPLPPATWTTTAIPPEYLKIKPDFPLLRTGKSQNRKIAQKVIRESQAFVYESSAFFIVNKIRFPGCVHNP